MEDVGKEGRTVLFVSHSMDNILRLCRSAILLKGGYVQVVGNSEKVINFYLKEEIGSNPKRRWNITEAPGNEVVRLVTVYAHKRNGRISENFDVTESAGITMEYEVLKPGYFLAPAFNFYNDRGINIFDSHNTNNECRTVKNAVGHYAATVWIPENFLSEGIIIVGAAIITPDPFFVHFHEKEAIAFNMIDSFQKVSARGEYMGSMPGMIRPLLQWESMKKNDSAHTGNGE
jgi:lipopolysaccharide transport system ATP-binding protein